MAKKTVFNRLSKMLPMSSELADQIDRADRAEYPAPELPEGLEIKGDETPTIDTTGERMDDTPPAPPSDQPAAPAGPKANPFAGKGA
jgi:recombinational DNA repair protein RecT